MCRVFPLGYCRYVDQIRGPLHGSSVGSDRARYRSRQKKRSSIFRPHPIFSNPMCTTSHPPYPKLPTYDTPHSLKLTLARSTDNSEDELERVAASYLLRPGSSFRRSPPIEENDRFADDGSVYLYREGDGIGNTDAEEYGMEDEAERYRARIQDHDDHGWREERMLRDRDHSRGEIDRFSLADNRPAIPPGVRGSISGSIRTPSGKVVSGGGAPSAQDVRTAGTRSTSFSDGGDVARHRERWRQLGGSESDRQLARDHVPSRSDGHSRGADVSELGRVIESKAGDATDAPHGREGRIMEQPPETVVPVCIEQMDSGLHSRKHGRSCAASGGGEAKYGSSNTKLRRMAVRLRQMILDRQASTDRSIRQVFGHFDRRGCGYVNAEEMRDSLTDLRFDVTPSEAQVNVRK